MLKSISLLRNLHSYIFRYLPWFIFIFMFTFYIPSFNVKAATYGYSSGTYAIGWSGCSISGTNCYWNSWGSQLDYGERTVKPDLDGTTYGSRISIRVYGGSNYTYKKNNTYHFKYTFSTTSDIYNSISFWYLYQTNGNTTSSTSGQFKLDEDADVIGYKIVKNNTGDNYFDIIISISPSQDYKYFNFYLSMPIATTNLGPNSEYNNVLTIYGIPQNIQLRSLEVNYSEGVGSQIDNQTTIINNNFNQTNNNIKDVNNSIKDTNNNIKDVNNSIKDMNKNITSSAVDTGALDDTELNNDNGVLSAILTLPLDFFQSLLNSISNYNSCPSFSFTLPFVDYPVTLPCVRNLMESLGATAFWESIGVLVGGLTMFYYLIHLGKELSDMMTLKETRAEWGGL